MDNQIIKNSIFKQRVYENIYMCNFWGDIENGYRGNLIREDLLLKCGIPMPLLKIGDEFYLEELSKLIVIKKAIRTSKDNVLYYIENKFEDTDKTEGSKLKAEADKQKYLEKQEESKLRSWSRKSLFYRLTHDYNNFDGR